jgi:hypothetical protein
MFGYPLRTFAPRSEESEIPMRRLLAAVAATGALLLAGCSTAPDAPTVSAPTGSASSQVAAVPTVAASVAGKNAGDAALAGNTAAICTQAAKTGGQFAAMFAYDLKVLIDAESAKDKDLAAKAKEKTSRDVDNYSFALTDMSKLVADPTVKKALAAMGKQVTALKGDVRKLDDSKLQELNGTLDKACGR